MMSRNLWGIGAILVAGALAAGVAQAQQPGGRGRGGFGLFGGGNSLIGLAANEAVQKDLGIGEAEKGKLETASREANEARREEMTAAGISVQNFQNLSDDERRTLGEKMAAVTRKVNEKSEAKLKEILSADQFKRLKEISIQAAGAGALSNPEVVKELGLNDDQTKKIADVQADYRQKRGALGRDATPEARRELSQEETKAVVAVLTSAQQEKLTALKGKEFDVSQLRQGRGGRPGGNRPGGNQGGGGNRTRRPQQET